MTFVSEDIVSEYAITISIGFAVCPGDAGDHDKLIKAADTALYKAKELGRNRVVEYSKMV